MIDRITKNESLTLRGIAIFCIMLHNFIHWMDGIVLENESSFFIENHLTFISSFSDFNVHYLKNNFLNIFSYVGWYGVPVFVFLTGYGLTMKYEVDSKGKPFRTLSFLGSNWAKLTLLILPAIICMLVKYLSESIAYGLPFWDNCYDTLSMLTFANTFFEALPRPNPFVYWYFGLTMQLYIIYAVAVRGRSLIFLCILTSISLVWQMKLIPSQYDQATVDALYWLRTNSPGWLLTFTAGIVCARYASVVANFKYFYLPAALLFIPSMSDELTWQLSPLLMVIIAVGVAKLSERIPYWRGFWHWMGRMSAFIFVAHPLVRQHIYDRVNPALHPLTFVALYVVLVFAGALIYRECWKLLKFIVQKVCHKPTRKIQP